MQADVPGVHIGCAAGQENDPGLISKMIVLQQTRKYPCGCAITAIDGENIDTESGEFLENSGNVILAMGCPMVNARVICDNAVNAPRLGLITSAVRIADEAYAGQALIAGVCGQNMV